jgi:hypothetical protein
MAVSLYIGKNCLTIGKTGGLYASPARFLLSGGVGIGGENGVSYTAWQVIESRA